MAEKKIKEHLKSSVNWYIVTIICLLFPGCRSRLRILPIPECLLFNVDNTVTLEMRKAETGDLIGGLNGKYSINKKENTIAVTIMGTKVFSILKLKSDVLTIKNISENKVPQTFERLIEKE